MSSFHRLFFCILHSIEPHMEMQYPGLHIFRRFPGQAQGNLQALHKDSFLCTHHMRCRYPGKTSVHARTFVSQGYSTTCTAGDSLLKIQSSALLNRHSGHNAQYLQSGLFFLLCSYLFWSEPSLHRFLNHCGWQVQPPQ